MAEEQKWQEPGGHRRCANNCGFFGSPTTLNLCSKCYKDHCLRERQISEVKMAVEKNVAEAQSVPCSSVSVSADALGTRDGFVSEVKVASYAAAQSTEAVAQPNRCAACRRRVGLTGFRCRCGTVFCGTHRYPEKHGCSFDFKALGREEIARANPVVKAEKVQRI